MQFTAISPYFIVRVPKKQEHEMRDSRNGILLHPNYVWMTRNTQCGEIVSISQLASKELPEAKVGDILIFHHFIQRSASINKDNSKFLIWFDDDYNYYNVNATYWDGNNNNCYGVWDGEKIIPHKEYVFLHPIKKQDDFSETKEVKYQKLEDSKNDIQRLAKHQSKNDVMSVLLKKEKEMFDISKEINKKEHLLFDVAYSQNSIYSKVYALNIAAMIEVDFMGSQYIVCESKYISAIPSFPN